MALRQKLEFLFSRGEGKRRRLLDRRGHPLVDESNLRAAAPVFNRTCGRERWDGFGVYHSMHNRWMRLLFRLGLALLIIQMILGLLRRSVIRSIHTFIGGKSAQKRSREVIARTG